MATPLEIVQQFNKACMEKDEALIRSLIGPSYTARCPLVSINSKEEALEMMKECPLTCHQENSIYIAEGNSVAQFFDWVVDAPFQGRIRTAQYTTVENGQIRSVEMFYDSSAFPKEMLEQVEQKRLAKAGA